MRPMLFALLIVSCACSSTWRYEDPTPAPSTGDAVVILRGGARTEITKGFVQTTDGKSREIPAYLRAPAEERQPIAAVEVRSWRCRVIGGLIGAAAGAALGYATVREQNYSAYEGADAIAGFTGAVGLSALAGNYLAHRWCSEPRLGEVE